VQKEMTKEFLPAPGTIFWVEGCCALYIQFPFSCRKTEAITVYIFDLFDIFITELRDMFFLFLVRENT